ncbi:MAG: ParB-like nuclease domain-containing protein [Sedimentisphaerales bacterium]|nr:ParB-like nuclease domain-containing protein [Sedimentisphaerales bacterium]
MNNKTTQLPLSQISYNQGTQFRKDGDPKVQEEYAALMQEGVVFPPIEVVFDGQHYYLWDGFTRYFAATEIGAETIACHITKGSLRDAQILACSANKTNGQPRSTQTKRHIIEFLLADEVWGKKTQDEIATHVGVTRGYVTRIAGENKRHGVSDNVTSNDIGVSDSITPNSTKKSSISAHKQGKRTTQKSKADKKEKKVLLDKVGKPVPKHLVAVFEGVDVITGFVRELDDLHKRVQQSMKTDPLLWHFFVATSFSTDIGNLKRQLKAAMPHAVCAFCGGTHSKTCQACKGGGFLNELRWNTVPKEMK